MKSPFFSLIFYLALLIGFHETQAQENNEGKENFSPHHSLGLVVSHAHVFNGRDVEGNRSVLSLPAWGLDYNYQFHPKWSIGLHTDIIVATFKVEKNLSNSDKGEVIERSYPVAPALMGLYQANDHWKFSFGAGGEFAKEGNYFLNRVGIEYSTELRRNYEVIGSLNYDIKWGAYDTWVLGIGIVKVF